MFHCLQTIWVSMLDGILPLHPLLSTPEPNLESESGDIVFSHFQCQTTEIVRHKITSGKNKSCILDPIPASLLSACLDSLFPAITNMINLSLQTRYFADTWKTAVVYPIIKKARPRSTVQELRPNSNLQFVSKLTELVVASQIQCDMTKNNVFPQLQSVYRSHQSTKGNKWSTHEYGQGPCISLTTFGLEFHLRHRWFYYNRFKQN